MVTGFSARTADAVALFRRDAARWIQPEAVAPLEQVTPRTVLRLLHRYRPLRAMAWLRFGGWARSLGVPGVTGMVQRRLARVYGLEMSPGADIAGGLYVAHPSGTTISALRVGENVSVIAAATIGLRGEGAAPRIGDRVYIGAGARVLGDIDIADDAVVGANAVVIHDVPAGATVVGVPARPVRTGG